MIPQTIVCSETGHNKIRSECQTPAEGCLQVAPDYLRMRGEIQESQLTQFAQYVNDCLGDCLLLDLEHPSPGWMGRLWANSCVSPSGVRLFWDSPSEGKIRVLLNIPGTPLRSLVLKDFWRMCLGFCHYYKLQCCRFDVALDDYSRRITVDKLVEVCRKRNYRLAEKYKFVESGGHDDSSAGTVYIGSRESEKYLRFYNAEKLHGILADRWEVELKRRHAAEALKQFCSLPVGLESEDFDGMASVFLASLVTGSADFVDAENAPEGERYDRLERLPFWQSLIDDVGGSLRLSPVRDRATLPGTFKWFKRQVACFLAVVRKGYGHQLFYKWLDGVLRGCEPRFSSYHKSVILTLQNELSKDMFPVS